MSRDDGERSAFWLLCRADTRLCAVPLAAVAETMRAQPVEALPGAPGFVAGLSIIRGAPVPVVDLAALFGEAGGPRGRLVACTVDGRAVALAVDGIPGIGEFAAASALPPLLREAASEAVEALRVRDGELLLLLDAARLVPEPAAA